MTMVTLDLTGTCPCGRSLRGVQVADATVRIRSLRLSVGLVGFERCANHGKPSDVHGVLTAESTAKVAAVRDALGARNARRRVRAA